MPIHKVVDCLLQASRDRITNQFPSAEKQIEGNRFFVLTVFVKAVAHRQLIQVEQCQGRINSLTVEKEELLGIKDEYRKLSAEIKAYLKDDEEIRQLLGFDSRKSGAESTDVPIV